MAAVRPRGKSYVTKPSNRTDGGGDTVHLGAGRRHRVSHGQSRRPAFCRRSCKFRSAHRRSDRHRRATEASIQDTSISITALTGDFMDFRYPKSGRSPKLRTCDHDPALRRNRAWGEPELQALEGDPGVATFNEWDLLEAADGPPPPPSSTWPGWRSFAARRARFTAKRRGWCNQHSLQRTHR